MTRLHNIFLPLCAYSMYNVHVYIHCTVCASLMCTCAIVVKLQFKFSDITLLYNIMGSNVWQEKFMFTCIMYINKYKWTGVHVCAWGNVQPTQAHVHVTCTNDIIVHTYLYVLCELGQSVWCWPLSVIIILTADREHVVDLLPHLWVLDGVLITGKKFSIIYTYCTLYV